MKWFLLLLFPVSLSAQSLTIAPHRVVMDGQFATVILANGSSDSVSVTVDVFTAETGTDFVIRVPRDSVRSFIGSYPSHIIVAPHQRQYIRLRSSRPVPSSYVARCVITSAPVHKSARTQFTIRFRQTIPVTAK